MHGRRARKLGSYVAKSASLAFAATLSFGGAALASHKGDGHRHHAPVGARALAVRVEPDKLGKAVPPSFLGFSIEHPDLPSYTGSATAPNTVFARLLRTLGSFGDGPATIRIGGHSSDQSWWNPGHLRRPSGVLTDIGPDWISGLNALSQRAQTPVILGLNLGLNDPINATQFANAAIAGLPSGSVRAFEIGNEPDLFTRPRVFHVGKRVLRRERHRDIYGFKSYADELEPYLTSLSGLGVPLGGGGFAGRTWDGRVHDLLGRYRGRLGLLSTHSYPLQTCGRARHRPPSKLIPRLLASRRSIHRVRRMASLAARYGLPLRVSETNSAVCGGVGQVSNSFASALWGTDVLFGFLKAGVSGINFHTFLGAWYAPVEFRHPEGRTIGLVRPLFYGMLLFAKATANRASLASVHWTGHSVVRIWATREPAGKLHVVALNLSRKISRRIRVRARGARGAAFVERLTAPSLGARHGVRLAGRSYGRRTFDGLMRGKLAKTRVGRHRGVYEFRLPAASGALLTVK